MPISGDRRGKHRRPRTGGTAGRRTSHPFPPGALQGGKALDLLLPAVIHDAVGLVDGIEGLVVECGQAFELGVPVGVVERVSGQGVLQTVQHGPGLEQLARESDRERGALLCCGAVQK